MSQDMTMIDCGDVLTIAQATDIYAQLCVAYEEAQEVSIDVSKLERIDTAAVQLLYSFQRDIVAKGIVVVWSEPSKVLCDAVRLLGLPLFYQAQ